MAPLVPTDAGGNLIQSPQDIGSLLANMPGGPADQGPVVWMPNAKREYVQPGMLFGGGEPPMMNRSRTAGPSRGHRAAEPGEMDANSVKSWLGDDEKRKKIIAYVNKRGIPWHSFDDLQSIWENAVSVASQWYTDSGGKIKKSPWDVLDLQSPPGALTQGPTPYRGQSYTQTQTSIDMASVEPETARAIVEQAVSNMLGRAPTQAEIEDFVSRANAVVKANPQKTTRTTEYVWDPQARQDANGNVYGDYVPKTTTSSSSGPDASELGQKLGNEAEDQFQSTDEYRAWEAAGPLFDALMQAIESPV